MNTHDKYLLIYQKYRLQAMYFIMSKKRFVIFLGWVQWIEYTILAKSFSSAVVNKFCLQKVP